MLQRTTYSRRVELLQRTFSVGLHHTLLLGKWGLLAGIPYCLGNTGRTYWGKVVLKHIRCL